MSIWNSEILDVSGEEVLNTYLDPFNYSHCWYEAFSWPFSTLGFNSFQLSLFSAFYNCVGHQSHFFPTLKYEVSACGSNILRIKTFLYFLKGNIWELLERTSKIHSLPSTICFPLFHQEWVLGSVEKMILAASTGWGTSQARGTDYSSAKPH